MSWSYSGDPSTSLLDKCRFMSGDTNSASPILQNEEIAYLIDTYANENFLYYNLFSVVATRFARDVKRSLGPQQEDPTERLNFFKERMVYYKKRAACSGLSIPKYAHPAVFKRGMQNDPPYSVDEV